NNRYEEIISPITKIFIVLVTLLKNCHFIPVNHCYRKSHSNECFNIFLILPSLFSSDRARKRKRLTYKRRGEAKNNPQRADGI
ncbi:hypothetical protein L9F63_024394, partial [Diploptera punctata]